MRKKLNLLFSALLIFTLCIFSAGCLDDIELSEDVPQAELSLKKNSDLVKKIMSLGKLQLGIGIGLMAIIILFVSYCISIKISENKEF